MVKQEVNFKDGTRIFYEESNGTVQRFIEYSYSPQEIEEMKNKPYIKSIIESRNRKHNAGKYYYLEILSNLVYSLDKSQKNQLYNDLKALHDKVGQQYDPSIINQDFLNTFGHYWKDNSRQCAAFFVTIYLAMLDLEESKWKYPNSPGKTMVLNSCKAVILEGKDPRVAATMYERKKETNSYGNDYSEGDSRYEKYGGYNGYDDDTIDEAFDGFPEATWNVD